MAKISMHQTLRDSIDLAIVLGTIDADRESLIVQAWENVYKAKNNKDALVFVDEAMKLKDERSDVVRDWLELESLERIKIK